MQISKIRPTSRPEWLEAAQKCPHATFFHTPMWAEIWAEYTAGQIEPAAQTLVFPDGEKAIAALCRRRRFGIFVDYISSPAGNFGGWVSADSLTQQQGQCIAEYFDGYADIEWRANPYDALMGQVALPAGNEDFTQAVDLRNGFDQVYAKWSRGHVNGVNKARKAGVVVRKAASIDDWKRHFACYRDLRSRWHRASTNYKWRLFDILSRANSRNIVLWLAELDGNLLSSVVCFNWQKHMVAWHGAAAQQHFNIRPNHFMYYEIMRHAAQDGFSWFDMNPSGGNKGVIDFKAHLGCEKLPCRYFVKRSQLLFIFSKLKKLIGSR